MTPKIVCWMKRGPQERNKDNCKLGMASWNVGKKIAGWVMNPFAQKARANGPYTVMCIIVKFQKKNPYPPRGRSLKIPRGRGS